MGFNACLLLEKPYNKMMLLQVTEAYAQSLSGRLADQIFSIVLLVGFAILITRKYNKLEEKLDKYMEEDRQEMQKIIDNNTKVLERILSKNLLLIVFLFGMMFVGCRTVKKTNITKKTDSSFVSNTEKVNSKVETNTNTQIKDSAIGIAGASVSGKLKGDDLKPVYNEKGEAKPNKNTIKGKGVNIDVTANTDGSIDVSANCDSQTIIIKGLIRQNIETNSRYDSLVSASKYNSHSEETISSKVKGGFNWLAFFCGFAVGAVAIYLINKFSIASSITSIFKRGK